MAEGSKTGIQLKLLVDKKSNTVLFAEAGKDMVDFLFSILSLPLAGVVGLLGKESISGAFSKLYESVETIDDSVMIFSSTVSPRPVKADILNPELHSKISGSTLQLPWKISSIEKLDGLFYKCPSHDLVSVNPETCCLNCNRKMNTNVAFVPSGTEGYVKGVVTYTITDDLVVTPLSTISSLALLKKHNVGDLSDLEEKKVIVGIEEGKQILNSSLTSRTVLTDVFLVQETKKEEKVEEQEKYYYNLGFSPLIR